MEQIKPPVDALDDRKLENISGGDNLLTYLQMFNLGQQLGAQIGTQIGGAFTPLINDFAFKKEYGEALKFMATYNDNTEYSLEEKAFKFAESWNSLHQGGGMTIEIAAAILSLKKYPNIQVQIACQDTISDVVTAYNKLSAQAQWGR